MNKMDKFQCIRTYQAVQLVSMSKDPMSKDSVPGFNSTTHHSYLCVFYSLCVKRKLVPALWDHLTYIKFLQQHLPQVSTIHVIVMFLFLSAGLKTLLSREASLLNLFHWFKESEFMTSCLSNWILTFLVFSHYFLNSMDESMEFDRLFLDILVPLGIPFNIS